MQQLDHELRGLAQTHAPRITFIEGDRGSIGPAHFILEN